MRYDTIHPFLLSFFLFGTVKADAILRHPDVADSHGLQQTATATAAPSPVEGGPSNGSWATGDRSPQYPFSNHSSPQYQPSSPDTYTYTLSNSDGWMQRAGGMSSMMSMPVDSFADFPILFDGYAADCLDDLFDDTKKSHHHPYPPFHEQHLLSLSAAASVDPVTAPSGPGSAGSGVSNRRGNAKSKAAAVGTCVYHITSPPTHY